MSQSPATLPVLPAMLRGYHGFHSRPHDDNVRTLCILLTQNAEPSVRRTLQELGVLEIVIDDRLEWCDTGYEFFVLVEHQDRTVAALHALHD